MSFSDNIEYLMAHPGAVAVIVYQDGISAPLYAGHDGWHPALASAVSLNTATADDVTVLVGEHTILAECRDGERVAVVYPTGTPIAKVVRRLLRKAAGPKREMRKAPTQAPTATEAC